MPAGLLRFYLDGATEPFATRHTADGVTYSGGLDVPDGSHTIEVTLQRVGESESDRSVPRAVIVGWQTAPTITSPSDWSEAGAATQEIVAQANAGETVRFYANGVQKAEAVANGSGVATATIALDSSGLIGLDAVEVITAHRVIGGNLSHPSAAVHLVPVAGRVAASGVTTARVLLSSALLGLFRYRVGGAWDSEVLAPAMFARQVYRLGLGSGEQDGVVPGLPELQPSSYLGGIAPGYLDPLWLREHVNRAAISDAGKTSFHLKLDGSTWPAVPFWFDVALLAAQAYFRGDRTAFDAYKAKVLEVLSAVPTVSGLVQHGLQWSMRLRGHGWPGTPVDRGETWYDAHTGAIGDVAITEPTYWPETHATVRYLHATRLFRRAALLEGDAATVSACDSALATFVTAITAQVRGDGFLTQSPYNPGTDNLCWAATIEAVAVSGFTTEGQRTATAAALLAKFNLTDGRIGGGYAADGMNLSPFMFGTVQYAGKASWNDVTSVVGSQYAFPHFSGQAAAALAVADATAGRTFAEDAIRFAIAHAQHGLSWLELNMAQHHGSGNRWTHWASHAMVPSHSVTAWLREADDRYADLAPIVVNGAQGSTATLDVPFGHRVVAADVVASSSCTATIEISAAEDRRGAGAFSATWPPTMYLGTARLMASIDVDGASASKTSGFKSHAANTGGRITVRVASVTGAPPASFTVTLKQPRIEPTLEADPALGFADTFATDRLAEYTAIEGSTATCSIVQAADTVAPLTRSMLRTTAAGWTTLVQSASSFADGVVLIDKARRTDATVNASGYPSIYPLVAAIFRASADGQTFIRVRSDGYVQEVVNGAVVATLYPPGQDPEYETFYFSERGWDERYLLAILRGTSLRFATWDGGVALPLSHGAHNYGSSPFAWGTVTVSNVLAAGRAGFGLFGPCDVDAVRICGEQEQPIPPGFMLDTGGGVPSTELVIPSCHVTGEAVIPASSSSCLRNEWGARVSAIVSGHNPRWSY